MPTLSPPTSRLPEECPSQLFMAQLGGFNRHSRLPVLDRRRLASPPVVAAAFRQRNIVGRGGAAGGCIRLRRGLDLRVRVFPGQAP